MPEAHNVPLCHKTNSTQTGHFCHIGTDKDLPNHHATGALAAPDEKEGKRVILHFLNFSMEANQLLALLPGDQQGSLDTEYFVAHVLISGTRCPAVLDK